MKRFFLTLLGLTCFSALAHGQQEFLKANIWKIEDEEHYAKFDNRYFYTYSDYSSEGLGDTPVKREYYLSNNPSINLRGSVDYNSSLVGNTTHGKYIITSSLVFEIGKYGDLELHIKPLNTLGGKWVKFKRYTGPLPAGFQQLISN